MDQIKQLPFTVSPGGATMLQIPDEVGQLTSSICISAFQRFYRLGCVEPAAHIFDLRNSVTVVDDQRSSVFHILSEGAAFSLGTEDWKWGLFDEECIFYSDSGIFLLTSRGVRVMNFLLLNEYHSAIIFSEIHRKVVLFEMGDSNIVSRTVSDLDDMIGEDARSNEPKLERIAHGTIVYHVHSEFSV